MAQFFTSIFLRVDRFLDAVYVPNSYKKVVFKFRFQYLKELQQKCLGYAA